MAKGKSKRLGTCTYCGYEGQMTRDHVPPKCLFDEPRPSNLVTIDCCRKCHVGTTADDEYFRLMLTMRDDVSEHRGAQRVLPSVLRSLQRKEQVQFARAFARSCNLVDVVTPSGIWLERRESYQVSFERLLRVVERTTLGLYRKHFGKRLEEGYAAHGFTESGLKVQSAATQKRLREDIAKVLANPKHAMGDTFYYHFSAVPDQDALSVWVLTFYDKVKFLVVTREEE
jgi:hypothetical protein